MEERETDFDDGGPVSESSTEEDVRVGEETIFQTDDDELRSLESSSE